MDLKALGKALKEVRERLEVYEKQVVEPPLSIYADESSLRKLEAGKEKPRRHTLLRLLIEALGVKESFRINVFLELADYSPITKEEAEQFGLETANESRAAHFMRPEPGILERASVVAFFAAQRGGGTSANRMVRRLHLIAPDHPVFVVVGSLALAASFGLSPILETVPQFMRFRGAGAIGGTVAFCLTLFGCLLAGRIACLATRRGDPNGIWKALGALVGAGFGQFVLLTAILPAYPVAPGVLQIFSAQNAHLKNTLYTLLFGGGFWLLPYQCALALQHEAERGNARVLIDLLTGGHYESALVPTGTIFLNPSWLLRSFTWALVAAVPMGLSLVINVALAVKHPGPSLSWYFTFLVLRNVLWFGLSAGCLAWYQDALATLKRECIVRVALRG